MGLEIRSAAWRRARIGGALLLIVLASGLIGERADANGWAHGAIPLEALIAGLEAEDETTRARSAQYLGLRLETTAVGPLLEALARSEFDHTLRGEIYTALGRIGDVRALPALSGCLDGEDREELRGLCLMALALFEGHGTLPLILDALGSEPSLLARSRAVDALGHFQDPEAVAALAGLVTGRGNASLRLRAINSLGLGGGAGAALPLLEALERARGNPERFAIVDALLRLRAREATEPLTRLLGETDDPGLRARIVAALGASRDGDAYATFIEMLGDPVPAVRYYAIRALHALGRAEAAGPLREFALAISAEVAGMSAAELVAEAPRMVVALNLQVAALRALADLDAAAGLPALLAAAEPTDLALDSVPALKIANGISDRRRVALYGLGYSGSGAAAELLAGPGGLGSGDWRLRATAARALAVLGFDDALDLLLPRLGDESAEVRRMVAEVLGLLGDVHAVEPLIARLADENGEVRKKAALSLGYLGDARALGALAALRDSDGSASVRRAAAYAEGLLAGPE